MICKAQIILLAFFVAGLVPVIRRLTVGGANESPPSGVVVGARL